MLQALLSLQRCSCHHVRFVQVVGCRAVASWGVRAQIAGVSGTGTPTSVALQTLARPVSYEFSREYTGVQERGPLGRDEVANLFKRFPVSY